MTFHPHTNPNTPTNPIDCITASPNLQSWHFFCSNENFPRETFPTSRVCVYLPLGVEPAGTLEAQAPDHIRLGNLFHRTAKQIFVSHNNRSQHDSLVSGGNSIGSRWEVPAISGGKLEAGGVCRSSFNEARIYVRRIDIERNVLLLLISDVNQSTKGNRTERFAVDCFSVSHTQLARP